MFRPDDVQPAHEPFALAVVVRRLGSKDMELHLVGAWAEDVEAAEAIGLAQFSAAGEVQAVRAIAV